MNSADDINKCNDEGGCDPKLAFYRQQLSTGVNVFFAIAFFIPFAAQLILGIKGRMWSFTLWTSLGIGFEVVGYLARTYESKNPFSIKAYTAELATLLLAPTFLAAALSVTFKHIVLYYDPRWSWLKPKLYPFVFVGTDFISIFIQLIGAAAAASAVSSDGDNAKTLSDVGEGCILAGVIFQVINMLACSTLMLVYAKRRKSAFKRGQVTRVPVQQVPLDNFHASAQQPPPSYGGYAPPATMPDGYDSEQGVAPKTRPAAAKEEKRAKIFVWGLMAAYTLIILRCTYRIFEAVPDFGKDVKHEPTYLYVFDGALMCISCWIMVGLHPTIFFPAMKPRNGKGEYQQVFDQSQST